MSKTTAPIRSWSSFDEYQEYQIGIYSASYANEAGDEYHSSEEYDAEDAEDVEDENYYSAEEYEEKERDCKKTIKFTEPIATGEAMAILQTTPDSYFNRFGKVVFNKPYYYNKDKVDSDDSVDSPFPSFINIKAYTQDNLTTSIAINMKQSHFQKKDFINDIYESIVKVLSSDENFSITCQNSFYSMDVDYIGFGYNEKFQINLYVDKDNEYDVFIEMKGISKSNTCNVFFFYHINKALKKLYTIDSFSSYVEGGCPVEKMFSFGINQIGVDFLPPKFNRSIHLNF